MDKKKIVVVGAGPAGIMAAIRAAELGQDVTLIEKNPAVGSKLALSGKGRCNLTNSCDLDSFLSRFLGNGGFLRDAFKKFFNSDLINFFEKRGLKLKIERQLRVFPVTDRSVSIVNVLKKELHKNKVNVLYKRRLKDIITRDKRVKAVLLEGAASIPADRVILACGGVSYPFTGSTGEGLKIAAGSGHRITRLRPGLVPLETRQDYPRRMEGLALKNIRVRFFDGEKEMLSDIGELIFTASGISGPLVLSLSGHVADWLAQGRSVSAGIDLKPALSREQLNGRILREFKAAPKKSIKRILAGLLPAKMIGVFLEISAIPPQKKANQVTQKEREALVTLLKCLRLNITKTRPIEEAMVTRGGVSLKDINPRTMESRIISWLYFCGEMIDVDADTGGFNLQAAFSTGYLAGESAARN